VLVRGGEKGVLGTGEVMIGSTGTNRIDSCGVDLGIVKNCYETVILSGVEASRSKGTTPSKAPLSFATVLSKILRENDPNASLIKQVAIRWKGSFDSVSAFATRIRCLRTG
jgi:hypothetical protein